MKASSILLLLLAAGNAFGQQSGGNGVPGGPGNGGSPSGAASGGLTGTYPSPGLNAASVASAVASQPITPSQLGASTSNTSSTAMFQAAGFNGTANFNGTSVYTQPLLINCSPGYTAGVGFNSSAAPSVYSTGIMTVCGAGNDLRFIVGGAFPMELQSGYVIVGPLIPILFNNASNDPDLQLEHDSSTVLPILDIGASGSNSNGVLGAAGLINPNFGTCGYGQSACPTSGSPANLVSSIPGSSSGAQYSIHGAVACHQSTTSATVVLTVKYTDPSSTAQTIPSGTANCTTLGPSSVAALDTVIRALPGTAISYYVTTINSPGGYEASVGALLESVN
jgi:hypothetical protein